MFGELQPIGGGDSIPLLKKPSWLVAESLPMLSEIPHYFRGVIVSLLLKKASGLFEILTAAMERK